MEEEQFIDTRHVQAEFERARARFMACDGISAKNKELIERFLRDSALGKTVRDRAKRRIGPSRMLNYLHHLSILISSTEKNLDELTNEDMERFIELLSTDRLKSRNESAWGRKRKDRGVALSERYKVDVKITVRQFYKWMWGNCRVYPEIVDWIDTYCPVKEIPALTEGEVETMLDRSRTPLQRALIQTLFDGGFRIGELLNVRLRHVRLSRLDPYNPANACFVIRVPFSKTLRRTVVLPMPASTKWLRQWLEAHPAQPRIRPDGEIEADDTSKQLFPIVDCSVRTILRRAGRNFIGRRVYPHLMRHTSATFWANRLPYFKFCKRFGWSMTSNMPKRYIDRAGVDETEVAQIYHQDEQLRLRRENELLRAQLMNAANVASPPSSAVLNQSSESVATLSLSRRVSTRLLVPEVGEHPPGPNEVSAVLSDAITTKRRSNAR